jgi:hypothetical protein
MSSYRAASRGATSRVKPTVLRFSPEVSCRKKELQLSGVADQNSSSALHAMPYHFGWRNLDLHKARLTRNNSGSTISDTGGLLMGKSEVNRETRRARNATKTDDKLDFLTRAVDELAEYLEDIESQIRRVDRQ